MTTLFFTPRNPLAFPLFGLCALLLVDGAVSGSLAAVSIGLLSLAAGIAARQRSANDL